MATPVANSVPLTGIAYIDGLTQGSSWQFGGGSHQLTYSLSLNDDPNGGPWTPLLSNAFVQALFAWSNVANLTFVESGSGTQFNLSIADIAAALTGSDLRNGFNAIGLGIIPDPAFADQLLAAAGYTRGSYPRPEGDVFFDNYYVAFGNLAQGGLGYEVLLHEIGHALGLKHSFDNGGNGRLTFAQLGIGASDNSHYTVMSYNDSIAGATDYAGTPMIYDIAAIQSVYGANMAYHTGHDTYTLQTYSNAIWDAGGEDTLDASAANPFFGAIIDLRQGSGSYSKANPSVVTVIAYGVTIENAIGSGGNDTIVANDLSGWLDGGAGADIMVGGLGHNTFVVDNVGDQVNAQAGAAGNTVLSSINYALPANARNLTLTGLGDINGTGNTQDNLIFGNPGVNALTGGTGNDTLIGGAGLDTAVFSGLRSGYTISKSGFGVTISGPDGTDTLSGMERAQFSDVTVKLLGSPLSDVNSDGKADLLFHNNVTGTVEVLQMNGVNYSAYKDFLYPASWQPVNAQADFNGDGKSDIVMRSSTGTIEILQMDGVNYNAYHDYLYPANWQPVDVRADFNGDGKNDIVMRSASGTIELLQMDGVNYTAYRDYAYPASWQVVDARADFNGDGKTDLVMRDSTTGTIEVLQMNGVNYSAYHDYFYPASWQVVETRADFNGDGKNDLVMRSSSGMIEVLQMDGVNYTAYRDYAYPSSWQVVDAKADFNGDGKSDLVMRDSTTGTVEILQMDGVNYTAYRDYAYPSNWQVVDAKGDFNGDGKNDLVMRNTTSGTIEVLQMDGVNYTTYRDYAYPANWAPVDTHTDVNGDGKSDIVMRNNTTGTVEILQMDGVNYTAAQTIGYTTDWQALVGP